MIQRSMLIISVVVTSFILVVTGALADRVINSQQPGVGVQPEAVGLDSPEVITILEEREAEYQALIDEANQKLAAAYETQEELASRLEQEAPTASQAEYEISPELAVGLALSVAPSAKVSKRVELVMFQGMVAYEVILDRGAVYIGAENGWLLHNSVPSVETISHDGGFEDDDDEHEDEDDD